MPSKSFFTLPAKSLEKKYGSEALLGHATRYHGDVNLKNTILTGILHWLRLTLATYFLLKIDHPLYFSSKKGRPSLNIPEWVTWHLKTKTPASPVSKSLENSLKRLQQGRIKLSKLILHIAPLPIEILLNLFLERIRLPCDPC